MSSSTTGTTRGQVPPRVLVVDDEVMIALDVAEAVREMGFEVIGPAFDALGAARLLRHEVPDLAVIDLNLGRGVGGETLVRLLDGHGCRCLVLSGDEERSRTVRERFPRCQVVIKPSPQRRLKIEVDRLAQQSTARRTATDRRLHSHGSPSGPQAEAP